MGVSKVVLGNDTVMDITDSTVTSENLLKNEVAYGANGNRIVGSFDANKYVDWESNSFLGAKNIIKFPYVYGSGSSHGLTITVNDDGSVTANGQPNQTVTFPLVANLITEYGLEVGDKLIISENNVENNNASAALIYVNPSGAISLVQGDYELTVTSEMVTKGVAFILWFNTGVDLTTPVTFKPMIRLDTDPDDDWVPPALTNRKLTEWVSYLNSTKSSVQANPSGTSTGNLTAININGVIYAVQGGGSNVQSDWDETDTTSMAYIQNAPRERIDKNVTKNLLYFGYGSSYGSSSTFTINFKFYGEIAVNGTPSSDGFVYFNVIGQLIMLNGLKAGDIIVFSEKYGYDANKCYFALKDYNSGVITPINNDYEYTVTGNEVTTYEAGSIQLGVFAKANQTFDNYILRPMCRLKGENDTWVWSAPNDIQSGLWIANLRNGIARDNTKVSKSGDTMTGMFNTTYKVGTWVGSLTQSAINLSEAEGSFGGLISAPTKNGRIAIATYQGNDDKLYIGYGEKGRTTNSYTRSIAWNGATGKLEADITGNAATADNAAKLNGYASDTAASANTIVRRQANGYIYAVHYNASCGNENINSYSNPTVGFFSTDGWLRKTPIANFKTAIGLNKDVPSNAVFTDTNNAVTQTNTTGAASYRVLFSATADDTNRTEGARKGRLYFDPGNVRLHLNNGYGLWGNVTNACTFQNGSDSNHAIVHGAYNNDGNQWGWWPNKDGWESLGVAYRKWGQIYSSNSAISTSDRNEKKDIVPLDESAKDFIMSLNPVSYKFKNGESGRTHYGMIAQDIEEEMTKLGMTTMDFAGLIKYPKKKQIFETINGVGQFKDIPIDGEYSYGLRYEEFMAPAIKTIQMLQEEIDLLKQRIDILEEQLNG